MVSKKKAARGIPPVQQQLAQQQVPTPQVLPDEDSDEEEEDEEVEKEEEEEEENLEEESSEEKSGKKIKEIRSKPKLIKELRALGLKQKKIIKPQRLTRELRALGLETEALKPSRKTEDQSNEDEEKSNEGEEKTNEDDRQEENISTAIYSAITSDPGEPSTFEEAFFGPDSKFWRPAIYKEIINFANRKVWKKVNKKVVIESLKRKLMTTKWIFKKKVDKEGNIIFKARCVSRGFMQIPGVDYTESFAPVASDTGIRVVIGIFLYYLHQKPEDNWVLESFDVEAAFLNAVLTHPVYRVAKRYKGVWIIKRGGMQNYMCRTDKSNVRKH